MDLRVHGQEGQAALHGVIIAFRLQSIFGRKEERAAIRLVGTLEVIIAFRLQSIVGPRSPTTTPAGAAGGHNRLSASVHIWTGWTAHDCNDNENARMS